MHWQFSDILAVL